MEGYLTGIARALSRDDGASLAAHFVPFSQESGQLALITSLQASRTSSKPFVSQVKRIIQDDHFASFVAAYLVYIRDADPNSDDPAVVTRSYKLLEVAFGQARNVLIRSDRLCFVPTLHNLASSLVTLAFEADACAVSYSNANASSAARVLTLTLNAASSGESSVDQVIVQMVKGSSWAFYSTAKKAAVLLLANQTLKIYFQLKNPRMGNTVVKNVGDAHTNVKLYCKRDRVTFLYYTGRMSLFERSLRKAAGQLDLAFRLCETSAFQNQRLTLIYLITARMPLGIFPSDDLLQIYDLQGPFSKLITATKQGHFAAVARHLDLWRDWHLQKGTYLLLREKLQVLCWRNLIRKVLWITDPPNLSKKSPVLTLSTILVAAQLAFEDASLDMDDMECMVVSLIDQGYIKAYIYHSTAQVVFAKQPPHFGFPPVSTVSPLH